MTELAETTEGAEKAPVGSIYFLIRGDRIKVGFSVDVERRMATFQHTTDDLLARIDNVTISDERAAHQYLSRWRVRGEWFMATAECLEAVQELVDGRLDPYRQQVDAAVARERRMRAKISAHVSWANTADRTMRTAPARAALEAKFLDQADGDPVRAEHLRKAYYQRLALKSAEVRRNRRAVR